MTQTPLQNTYDYIIIGAGSAGCMLAKRLTENPAKKVLLIEAGKNDNYIWIHIPVGYLYCIDNPRADWRFKTVAEKGLNGRSLLYPRGRVLGGCSSINGMIYMRGQARDYDGWAQATGDSSWSWDNALPDFKRHEDYYKGADAMHGAGGEWRIYTSNGEPFSPLSVTAKVQSYNGASNVQPVVTSRSIVYVQAQGARVREINYSWESQSYNADDITVMAPHLVDVSAIPKLCYVTHTVYQRCLKARGDFFG